jgi:hypothetical protein
MTNASITLPHCKHHLHEARRFRIDFRLPLNGGMEKIHPLFTMGSFLAIFPTCKPIYLMPLIFRVHFSANL